MICVFTGEDSSELSAAGQMDTMLGVRGSKQIHKAVTKCWASHFAHPAVEYRRYGRGKGIVKDGQGRTDSGFSKRGWGGRIEDFRNRVGCEQIFVRT